MNTPFHQLIKFFFGFIQAIQKLPGKFRKISGIFLFLFRNFISFNFNKIA